MIDRQGRDRLALALRRYVVCRINSDELDEAGAVDWRARAVGQLAWNLHSDDCRYADGEHTLGADVRRDIARWIVFLHSDQEYLWPEYRFDTVDWLSIFRRPREWLQFGSFQVRKNQRNEQFLEAGDPQVWPFLRRADLNNALHLHAFFRGARSE